MPPQYLPLRWESTRDQWWYVSPIDWAAANGYYNLVRELLHLDTNLLIKLTSLRRIRRLETVWDDEKQFEDVPKFRSQARIGRIDTSLDELEDAKDAPEVTTANFTCAMFESPEAVLKGARHMAAVEISCEPCVRKHVRRIFMDNAMVSTIPTPDGNVAIDALHQFAGVKWL